MKEKNNFDSFIKALSQIEEVKLFNNEANASSINTLNENDFIDQICIVSEKSNNFIKIILEYLIDTKITQLELINLCNNAYSNLSNIKKHQKIDKVNYIYSLYSSHKELKKDLSNQNTLLLDTNLLYDIFDSSFNRKERNIVNTATVNIMIEYIYGNFNGLLIKLFISFYPNKIEGSINYKNINLIHSFKEINVFLEGITLGIKQACSHLNFDYNFGTYIVWTNQPTIDVKGLSVTVGATIGAILAISKYQKKNTSELERLLLKSSFTGGEEASLEVTKILNKVFFTNTIDGIENIYIPNKLESVVLEALFCHLQEENFSISKYINVLSGEWNEILQYFKGYSEQELKQFFSSLKSKLKYFPSYRDLYSQLGLKND